MGRKIIKKVKVIAVLAVIFIVSILILSLSRILNDKKEQKIIGNNLEILKKMERIDVTQVEEEIRKKQEQIQYLNANENSSNKSKSNKEYFENDVFIGDSITEELQFYDVLNKSSVLATKGHTVIKGKNSVGLLQDIKPKRIFILYGLNDLVLFQDSGYFKKNYIKLIQAIKEKSPNSEIYIQSSMPVQERVEQVNECFSKERLEKFIAVEKEVSEEQGINYIDIRPVVKGREELYEQDGMHFKKKFCELWLEFIKSSLENNIKKDE